MRDSRFDDEDEAMLEGLIPELRALPGVTDPLDALFRFAAMGASGRVLYGGANSIEDAKRAAEDALRELGPDATAGYACNESDRSQRFLLLRDGSWLKGSGRR